MCPAQAQNKATALDLLKARLLVIAQEQQLQEVAQIRGDMIKAGEFQAQTALDGLSFSCMVV